MGFEVEPQIIEDDLHIGSVISRTFAVFKERPLLFLTLGLIAGVPVSLLDIILSMEGPASSFLNLVVGGVICASIAYAVYQILLERDVTLGEALSSGLSRLGPLILASILMNLGITVGTVFLIVPGIILACMWLVTIPSCSVESLGPLESLGRSYELTKGYRGKIFLLLLVTIIVFFLLAFIFILAVSFFAGVMFGGGGYDSFESSPGVAMVGLAVGLLIVVGTTLYDIMVAVVYYDLRAIKEGLSLESLADIFD